METSARAAWHKTYQKKLSPAAPQRENIYFGSSCFLLLGSSAKPQAKRADFLHGIRDARILSIDARSLSLEHSLAVMAPTSIFMEILSSNTFNQVSQNSCAEAIPGSGPLKIPTLREEGGVQRVSAREREREREREGLQPVLYILHLAVSVLTLVVIGGHGVG